jgi:hypothetical protein
MFSLQNAGVAAENARLVKETTETISLIAYRIFSNLAEAYFWVLDKGLALPAS